MRQIVLDTETTGLKPAEGHRIIEIGCIEIANRRLTGNRFHAYINPERDIDKDAADVHGISSAFLADKPRFAEVANDLIDYISEAEVIIHNAPFDVGFIDHELNRLKTYRSMTEYCTVVDSLALAKTKHPGQRNSLDALCKRYGVDNSHRDLHGALLDAEILALVYLAMTGGQTSLLPDYETAAGAQAAQAIRRLPDTRAKLNVIYCTDDEQRAHERRLDLIDQHSEGRCLWREN